MSDFPIVGLRSVAFGLPDPAAAEAFYVAVWKLEVAARAEGAVYLRGTGTDHHVLSLHPHPEPAVLSVTFRAASAEVLAQIADRVPAGGGTLLHGPRASEDPAGGTAIAFVDNQERVVRVVHGDRTVEPLPASDSGPDSRPERLTHVNINSRDVDASREFFQFVLGFRLSDRSGQMAFARTNRDHHSVVIATAPVNGFNHAAFLLPEWESVMVGAGRLVDAGFPIAWGVGRHGPGDNVFAYFIGPAGFVIEYTAEVLQVDDTYQARGPKDWAWPPGRVDQWGIAPPKTDACKHAQLAILYAPTENVAAGYEG